MEINKYDIFENREYIFSVRDIDKKSNYVKVQAYSLDYNFGEPELGLPFWLKSTNNLFVENKKIYDGKTGKVL